MPEEIPTTQPQQPGKQDYRDKPQKDNPQADKKKTGDDGSCGC
jgi:hypothetical protein